MLRSDNDASVVGLDLFSFQNLDSFLESQVRERHMGVILLTFMKVFYSAE